MAARSSHLPQASQAEGQVEIQDAARTPQGRPASRTQAIPGKIAQAVPAQSRDVLSTAPEDHSSVQIIVSTVKRMIVDDGALHQTRSCSYAARGCPRGNRLRTRLHANVTLDSV